MASLLTHLGVGLVAGKLVLPSARRVMLVAAFLSAAPDLDVITFAFGIPYSHVLGHRGLSHSLVVAVAAGLLGALALRARPLAPTWILLAVVTASHGLLDALTDGGLGVAFFAPFENSRYFFPWQPIRVSPIGVRAFFTGRGLQVLASELVVVWIPLAVVALALSRWRRRRP